MLAEDIEEQLSKLDPAKQSEIRECARRLRVLIEAHEPYGWFALSLVAARWTQENNAQGKAGDGA